ncbi:MAG TPA: DUF945 family protein [Burkholderiales bacterium]|nr:DUF945 family protein [Burkholderiales bacterium]
MKKTALIVVPLGILVATACAAPWYVGVQTEEAMRVEATKLASSAQFPLNVSYTHYERGWLSSSAVTRLTLKAEPSIYLDVRHEISQLPDPRAGWVQVHSVPQWSGPVKQVLDHYFGGQPAFAVDTVVGFDGSRQTVLSSPAFSKPVHDSSGAKLTWGGLQGKVMVSADQHLTAVATAPHLGLDGGDNQAGLEKLKLEANWDVHGTTAEWQGDTKITLGEFRFAGPRENVAVKDLSGAAYQRSKGESLLLGYVVSVGSGSSAKAGEMSETFSNAVLDLEFDQINKKALAKYLDNLGKSEKLALAPGAQSQFNAQQMVELGGELLRGSPVIRLKKLGIETPSGGILAQGTVSFDGSNLTEIHMSPDLLTRLKAKGNLEIGGNLLRSQMQRKVRPQVEVALTQQGAPSTEENIKALAEKLAEQQLKALTDNGLLRPNGANFTVEAELASGQVLVNGQPATQLFGGAMTPPVPMEQLKPAAHAEQEAAAQPAEPIMLVRAIPGRPLPNR